MNCSCGNVLSENAPDCLNACGNKSACPTCCRKRGVEDYCNDCLDVGFKCPECNADVDRGHIRTKAGYVRKVCKECFQKKNLAKCVICKNDRLLMKCPDCQVKTTCVDCVKSRNTKRQHSLVKTLYCDTCLSKTYNCPDCGKSIGNFGHEFCSKRDRFVLRLCDGCKFK